MRLIETRGLAGGYGAANIVHGIDLAIDSGRCLVVLGPNGAGKSTLLRLLAGILPASAGTVELLGRPFASWRRRDLARTVAYVPQQVHFAFPLTVREVVEQGRSPHLGPWRAFGESDRIAVDTALRRAGLAGRDDEPVQRLSGGQRQSVLLARALATEARVLLFDEPATALDVRHQLDLAEALGGLERGGVGSVVVLHDWNLAVRLADELLVLHRGRVHACGPTDAILSPGLFRAVFGVEVEILHRPDGPRLVVPLTPITGGDATRTAGADTGGPAAAAEPGAPSSGPGRLW